MSNRVRHLALRLDDASSCSVLSIRNEQDFSCVEMTEQIRNDRESLKWQSELSVTSVFSWMGLFPFSHTEELISELCCAFEKFSIRIVMLKYEASALL